MHSLTVFNGMSIESKESSFDEVDIFWKAESGSITLNDDADASGGRESCGTYCSSGVKSSFCSAIL